MTRFDLVTIVISIVACLVSLAAMMRNYDAQITQCQAELRLEFSDNNRCRAALKACEVSP